MNKQLKDEDEKYQPPSIRKLNESIKNTRGAIIVSVIIMILVLLLLVKSLFSKSFYSN